MKTCDVAAGALMLALALGGAPSQAMTTTDQTAPRAALGQGVIEQVSGATLRINGKTYTLASGAIFERNGARANPARLAAGKTVAFSLVDEGTPARIKELWLID
jgi:hypothetical protein